jgi:hypothetical protein
MCPVKGSCPSYLKLRYPEFALALMQHTIGQAVSNYSTKRLIISNKSTSELATQASWLPSFTKENQ